MSLEQVERIANALEVSVPELLGFTHNEPTNKLSDNEALIGKSNDLEEKIGSFKSQEDFNEILIQSIAQHINLFMSIKILLIWVLV